MKKICKICKEERLKTEFSIMRRKNRPVSEHSYCKKCLYKDTLKRRRNFKSQCLEYKGSECSICGYNKCEAALDFHHLDSTQKDFTISKARVCSFNEKVKLELDKCILLCANCHRELHFNEVEVINYIPEIKTKQDLRCKDCNKSITKKDARCLDCLKLYRLSQYKGPSKEQLEQDLIELKHNICAIGRKYGVSDNAVRKWFKKLKVVQLGNEPS